MIYTIILSNKEEIKISEAEFQYFKENMSASFLEFEAGIVNPSFVVSVIIDEEASREENRKRLNSLAIGSIPSEDYDKLKQLYYNKEESGVRGIKSMDQLLHKYDSNLKKLK